MAVVKIYDQNKTEVGEMTLAPEVFDVQAKPEILNLVVRAYRASLRAGTHAAKTRAFVSGGGKKPFKQKGTGNARQGSRRSPVMRGGAIIFGPQPRDYSFKVNKKVRALALRMALSSRVASDELFVLNDIDIAEAKTKLFAGVAKKLELSKALVIVDPENANLSKLILASRNIRDVKMITPDALTVYDTLNCKQIVLFERSVPHLVERLN